MHSRPPACLLHRAETDAVLVNAGVAWQPFSELAMAELPQVATPEAWQLTEAEAKGRRDLRGSEYFICSIDPPGGCCKMMLVLCSKVSLFCHGWVDWRVMCDRHVKCKVLVAIFA